MEEDKRNKKKQGKAANAKKKKTAETAEIPPANETEEPMEIEIVSPPIDKQEKAETKKKKMGSKDKKEKTILPPMEEWPPAVRPAIQGRVKILEDRPLIEHKVKMVKDDRKKAMGSVGTR